METTLESINEKPVPVSTPERNHFQGYLMNDMGIKRHSGHKEVEWADSYAKKVSDIIDFPDDKLKKEIRSLVDEGWKAYQDSLESDSEEERQILTEAWTKAYEIASEKIKNTFH